MTVLPWQTAANAQQFGLDVQQQHKNDDPVRHRRHRLADAVQDPGHLRVELRPRHLDLEQPLDKSIVSGVAKYGPYGAFGVPTYEAADVVMKAISSVCKAGQTPSRSNVLAAIKKTNIPARPTRSGFRSRSSPTATSPATGLPVQDQQRGQVHLDSQQVAADGPTVAARRRPAISAGGAAAVRTQTAQERCRSSSKPSSTGSSPGCLYALIALGYTMVYGVLKLLNFAHGDVYMVGAYIGYFVIHWFGGPTALAIPVPLLMLIMFALAAAGCGVLGVAMERFAYRPLRDAPRIAPLITALGISFMLENTVLLLFGGFTRSYETPTSLRSRPGCTSAALQDRHRPGHDHRARAC